MSRPLGPTTGASATVVLVTAKAPVPGQAKTRLAAGVGSDAAAALAAAALLDTLDACEGAFGPGRRHLALAGDLGRAARGSELAERLGCWTVHPQRGEGFAARLAHAHADVAAAADAPVVQVGMDTPQVTADHLRRVADRLGAPDVDAVLGPAEDGGWWVLGLRSPSYAQALAGVEMSTDRTGEDTRAALSAAGARVVGTDVLGDVDTAEDAERVAASAPHLRFSVLWRELSGAVPAADAVGRPA